MWSLSLLFTARAFDYATFTSNPEIWGEGWALGLEPGQFRGTIFITIGYL